MTGKLLVNLICFSHLRWNFVFQRPQHILTKASKNYKIIFIEEPILKAVTTADIVLTRDDCITILTPEIPDNYSTNDINAAVRILIDDFLGSHGIEPDILWYYTPMALAFSEHLRTPVVVYDCMDELSMFKNSPPDLRDYEKQLLARATLVFTGGVSLYEAKRQRHNSVYCCPSAVDTAHFAKARAHFPRRGGAASLGLEPPVLGYIGVIDERIDTELLAAVADLRPTWSIVMLGPVVKIDAESLPQRRNIVWVGQKSYTDLPSWLAGFDIALLPFALNDSTRFISPTKTPEYLAAGLPVISTPIADVVSGYGDDGMVAIAATAGQVVAAAERYLAESHAERTLRQTGIDQHLATISWDSAWSRMHALIEAESGSRRRTPNVARGPGWRFDYAIVGAGFAGSVMAERLANDAGKRVLLIDRRPHIGGNAYDTFDAAGILTQPYGPHIFHTNAAAIVDYLSRFTEWRPYEHRVLARTEGKLVPLPINRRTLNLVYGLALTEEEAAQFLAARTEPVVKIETSEDVIVSKVGRELYERFFRGYTRKQWGLDASELDKSVIARIPTRTNDDDRYFTDRFQAMPALGFSTMFDRILDHPNITRLLNTNFRDVVHDIDAKELIYTGPVDEYFDFRYGPLPYRSLEFQHETLDQRQYQPVAVVNYPDEEVPFTRITEFKHLTGQTHPRTSICREFPRADGDPYYPIPKPENQALYRRYEQLADSAPGVHFVGRLATYRYYNMDQVVAQALKLYDTLKAGFKSEAASGRGAVQQDALG